MKRIEVGEYVKTEDGIIDKVIIPYNGKCNNPNCSEKHISCKYNYYNEKDIVKHSKQLIDLIEPGDILEIEEEGYEEKYECLKSDKGLSIYVPISDYYKRIEDLKIKRVLTKEQFRQNSYEVGGEKC